MPPSRSVPIDRADTVAFTGSLAYVGRPRVRPAQRRRGGRPDPASGRALSFGALPAPGRGDDVCEGVGDDDTCRDPRLKPSMTSPRRLANLRRALNPRSVCYIGGSFLHHTVEASRRLGFDGEVWVVNPTRRDIAGMPCFDSVDDLPGAPDAVFVAVNREATNDLIPRLRDMGAGGVICYASGYSEVGGEGRRLETELRQAAGDLAVVGPNCYGIDNFVHGVPLLAVPSLGGRVERGCAFISQSGNLCLNVSNSQRGAPLAYVISCGNQAVLEVSDYIDALVDDPAITCFALFVETLPDIRRFSQVASRALEAGKPLIALKSGVSRLGAQMALSHTASLAGSDELYQALFDRLCVVRVESPVDLLETAKLITYTGIPEGRRLAVFTCSGGDSEGVADLVEPLGIELPQPTAAQQGALRRNMPVFANITNPLDYNTSNWGRREALDELFPVLLREGVDAGFLVIDSTPEVDNRAEDDTDAGDGVEAALLALRDAGRAASIPCALTSSLPENMTARKRRMMHAEGIAALQGIREGTLALARTCLFGERRRTLVDRAGGPGLTVAGPTALAGEPRMLNERDSKHALETAGIAVPRGLVADPGTAAQAAARIGYPVALKVIEPAIAHKSDCGAVKLGLRTAREVAAAAEAMAAGLRARRLLVENMLATPVAEMIVGVTRSEQFGHVLVVGAGGVLVELYRDSASLLLPLREDDVRAAIEGLRINALLDGFRGRPRGDRDALVSSVMAVASFVERHADRLVELDINPLFVMPEGEGAVAADALIRMI